MNKRGILQNIRHILRTLTAREEKVIRMHFGIDEEKRFSLEEIGQDFDVSLKTVKKNKNGGLRKFRSRVIDEDNHSHFSCSFVRAIEEIREYLVGINPDLIQKELPYRYSSFLDEFIWTLIDGKDWREIAKTYFRGRKQ